MAHSVHVRTHLSNSVDGSSTVNQKFIVASIEQINAECFAQTILLLLNERDEEYS